LKALFAPPRRLQPGPPPAPLHPGRWRAHPACRPRPPGRHAARRSAVAHGLDRPRCGGDRWQRECYTLNGMRDTSAARTSPTRLRTTA
jgi:hypothetical protein